MESVRKEKTRPSNGKKRGVTIFEIALNFFNKERGWDIKNGGCLKRRAISRARNKMEVRAFT